MEELLELRLRQAEMLLAELHHQTARRHSDLQRRFLFALTLSAGLLLSLLRAELPPWTALTALPTLGWAWLEASKLRTLDKESSQRAQAIIAAVQAPKASASAEANPA